MLGSHLASQTMPTVCVAVQPVSGGVEQLAARLRSGTRPVLGRVENGHLLLDLRSVLPREDVVLVEAFEALAPPGERERESASVLAGTPPDLA